MRVHAIAPDVAAGDVLSGSQFIDAYCVMTTNTALDARQAAERILRHAPRWMVILTAVRNGIVAPFGIKAADEVPGARRIGIFPVVSEAPDRLIAGFDDSHLDFRALIDVAPVDASMRVTVTTVVRTHNLFGRVYLAVILPFHKLVVRSMLKQV